MLSIHPIIQLVATLLALYVLLLGAGQFRRLHMHQDTQFNWQRHVQLGTIALLLWSAGSLLGLIMVKIYWHGFLITGSHGNRVYIIVPLILFGLSSGWYMHTRKKQRVLLPLIHGCANVLLIVLVFLQILSGWQVYNSFVLGN